MKDRKLFLNEKQIEKGITLISLVVTILVLLILAGVTLNLTLGEGDIFKTAEKAAKNYKDAENEELGLLGEFNENLGAITNAEFDFLKGVNKPKLLDGMTPIKFTEPTETVEGSVVISSQADASWYNYDDKKWANTRTQDGSMWVWIPRYAYKITYTNPSDKSAGGTVDVVFLVGTTDNYYDENGNIKIAQRATSAEDVMDTTADYTVHPAFTNESSINYANGGWDKELTGIWVAKFEAGYAGGNNTAPKGVSSGINYTSASVWAGKKETGTGADDFLPARNWTDGVYGLNTTIIKYPTFQGVTYTMNYINLNDSYNISRALTNNGNIYGLSSNSADSHLMKNSEWGAVAYLSISKYGLNGTEISINNISLQNSTPYVYAVTGCRASTSTGTTIEAINQRSVSNLYVWTQKEGSKASTTGTIYGIFDMSGGSSETSNGYIANGNENLQKSGQDVVYNGAELKTISTKYTTVYPHDINVDNSNTTSDTTAGEANYNINTKIYGDAIRETSKAGIGNNSWYGDESAFSGYYKPFLSRGGAWWKNTGAGLTTFIYINGLAAYYSGFRVTLVAL